MARDSRRRLRNYLFRPRLQLRYALMFFFLASIGAGVAQLVSYLTVRRVLERILSEAGASAAALAPVIDVTIRAELLRVVWILPILGIATAVFTVVVLHIFVGPLVPISRHIRRLTEGDYDMHSQLRAEDEFVEVVDDLNKLSETLKARHGTPSQEARLKATGTD